MLGLSSLKSDRDKARLFLMLNVALRAGLPLYQTLNIIKDSLPFQWRDVVTALAENLRRGYSLYQTMQTFRDIFEPLVLKLINVGESTGKLDSVCIYIFEYYESKNKIVNKLFSSMTYPFFIIVIAFIISFIILKFIIPVVINMYSELNIQLPLVTKILGLFVGLFNLTNFLIVMVVFFLILGFIYLYFGKDRFVNFIGEIFFNLPFISRIYRKFIVINFLYSFALCIKSGLTMSESIKLSLDLLPKSIYNKHFSDVYRLIMKGEPLSKILRNKPLFNRIIVNFIASYEETAKIEIIDKLTHYLTFDINLAIDSILVLVEPILIIGVSLFVFFIAASILMPIMGLVTHFIQ